MQEIYAALDPEHRLVLEYKYFEPSFYHMDVPDWGTSFAQVSALGERAVVCLDTGHHAPGTNIEFIVMQLLRLGKLGSFDFNSRFYADDDLIVGAADPFQLFRILLEVQRGGGLDGSSGVVFMLDQCHNVERKIPGQIRSVLNVQEMTARALLVDRDALSAAQAAGDVLAANEVVMDAFYTDVRPMLAAWRRGARSARQPAGRLRRQRLPGARRRRARRRHPGRLGRLSDAETDQDQDVRDPEDRDPMSTSAPSPVSSSHPAVADLVARSNRLGADPRNTNYAGGNTSAKGVDRDPVTGHRRRAGVGQGLRR